MTIPLEDPTPELLSVLAEIQRNLPAPVSCPPLVCGCQGDQICPQHLQLPARRSRYAKRARA